MKAEMTKAAEPAPAEATAEAPAPAQGDSPAKGDSAATAELLALGNKPAPDSTPATAAPAAGGSVPGGSVPGGANPDPTMSAPGGAAGGIAPGGVPGGANLETEQMRAANAPGGAIPGGVNDAAVPAGADVPGFAGAGPEAGGGGDAGGPDGPTSFRNPYGAVNAFLKALKARNAEKLAEATARRATTEASGPNQKLFSAILEQSLTEDDLNELANKLEGFSVIGNNAPKSTGRFSVILGKAGKNGESYRRTITARHEKDGWKVVDISGQGKIEKPIIMPRGRGGMTGRRR